MFFLFGISNIFLAQLDKLFIGFHYGFTHVGAYTAISLFPITVFNLVASSIGVIAMPYLIRNNTKEVISKKALAISFFFIPIPIFFFFHIIIYIT